MNCPKCQRDIVPQAVGFTWWGGLIGSKIINHCSCPACGARFNGRTGGDNTGAIAIYMVVVGVIAIVLFYAMFSAMR